MVNPYGKYLGVQNPFEVVGATTGKLERLLQTVGADRAAKAPAPGKWSVREILCHLADCELVFAFRFRQTVSQDHHTVQPFDQDHWAKQYTAYSAADALAAFTAFRHWNLLFLRSLPSSVYEKVVSHPERGQGTFQVLLETMAGHDLNHLAQIEAIAARND
jgi:uncharacterized damage-inducible protein DinB